MVFSMIGCVVGWKSFILTSWMGMEKDWNLKRRGLGEDGFILRRLMCRI